MMKVVLCKNLCSQAYLVVFFKFFKFYPKYNGISLKINPAAYLFWF